MSGMIQVKYNARLNCFLKLAYMSQLSLFHSICSTESVYSLRIYDPQDQLGSNPCSINKGGCDHLCLPISASKKVCKCALGYTPVFQTSGNHTGCKSKKKAFSSPLKVYMLCSCVFRHGYGTALCRFVWDSRY